MNQNRTWIEQHGHMELLFIDKVTSPKAYRGTVFQRVTTDNR